MLHERLEKLRINRGLSKAELCRQLKIPQTTYSGYALGTREPDLETITRLAKFYDVSVDYLITGSENVKKDPADRLIEYLNMELSNEEIIKRMKFRVDGMVLTDEEATEFVEFVRVRRLMKKQQLDAAKSKGP